MKYLNLLILIFLPYLGYSQLTIEDHLSMENISDPEVFGSQIIYAIKSKEKWNGKTLSSIILSDADGKDIRYLTENEYDYDPKWSPDGKHISFISYRDNLQQIYVIEHSGGIPRIVSDAQAYVSNYSWLDNKTIVYVDDESRDSLLIANEQKNGGGYWVGTEYYTNALWSYNILTGTKNKITDGSYRIIDFDISEDSKLVAIIGAKNYDPYESLVNSWIKVMNIQDSKIIYEFKGAKSLSNLRFSPSGKKLVFAGSTVGYAANDGLFVANLETGETTNLTYDFDPTIQNIQWIDNENLSFSTPRNGYTVIYLINFKVKIYTILNPYWVIYDYQISNNEIFFSAVRGSRPIQLYKLRLGNRPTQAIKLTNLNSDISSKIKTKSSLLNYFSKDGTNVQAVMTYPPEYDSLKMYPLMVIPHGGPDALVMNDFHWMSQYFADNGYIVFQPNFRGSIGYGRDFYAGNRNAFGVTDFEDIMSGVDKLIELKIVDPDKMVIGGWSYGGYMANWVITQTDRFKASISVAGVSNLVSLYGHHEFSNREIGIWEYKGLLIDKPENYRRPSPIFYVKNINTPLLILHGKNDSRSPTLQAWEMYRAMKDANKVVKMMLYPNAGHSISNPVQFKSVLKNWLNWANEHIMKE